MWHHDFKADGSYIPYPVNSSLGMEVLSATDIARSRNVIGWCPDARNLTGTWPPLPPEFDGSTRQDIQALGSGRKQNTINASSRSH